MTERKLKKTQSQVKKLKKKVKKLTATCERQERNLAVNRRNNEKLHTAYKKVRKQLKLAKAEPARK